MLSLPVSNGMNPVAFVFAYTKWHYGNALFDILRVLGNFLWLSLHFFSTGILIRTLFSPFMRMREEYPASGHFDPEYYAGTIVVNTLMRLVGFLVRTVFILLSFAVFSLIFISGIVFIGFWIVTPIVIPLLVSFGITLL